MRLLIGGVTTSTLSRPTERSEAHSLPIGKAAEYVSGTNDIWVTALTKEGVLWKLVVASAGRDPAAMLEPIKKVSPSVLDRIQRNLEKTFTPPALTPAPLDPCQLLTAPETAAVIGAAELSAHAREENPRLGPEERGYADPEELFAGRFNGGWSCQLQFAAEPDFENQNEATITISKGSVTVDDTKRLQGDAETIPRLGAHAYWVSQDRSVGRTTHDLVFHDRNWLSVVTDGGSRFEIELVLHIPGTDRHEHLFSDRHKEVSIELAKLVLGKLP